MKNISHLMVASKGCPQPSIRQHNNKIYVRTTNITALPPTLSYDRTRKPWLTLSLPSLSLSLSLSGHHSLPLSLSLSLSLSTHIHMDGWVGDIGEEGKKGQVEKADSHRTQCG